MRSTSIIHRLTISVTLQIVTEGGSPLRRKLPFCVL